MQISRHWRLNSQRYRLEGVRYEDGSVSLQKRPIPVNNQSDNQIETQPANEIQTEAIAEHRLAS